MIARLRGRVDTIESDAVIVDVGGVGYRVRVPSGTLAEAGGPGDEIDLYTHLYVREAELALYGATDPATLQLFEALLTVSGVGPRLAMSVLSTMPTAAFMQCVEGEAVDELTRIPGVGRKTAQRIILDLKGKLPQFAGAAAAVGPAMPDDEALLALIGLGYSRFEAGAALAAAGHDDQATVEERLRTALRQLATS